MKMTSVPGFSWITGTAIWPQLSPATTVLKSNKFASKSCGRKLARFRNNSNKHKQTMCTWPNGMQQDLSVLGSGLSKVRIRWGQNIHHWRCRILTRFTTVKIRHPEMISEWIKKKRRSTEQNHQDLLATLGAGRHKHHLGCQHPDSCV